jgi:hypothetical protein
MSDPYLRALLTVIAMALVVIASRGSFLETPAYAGDDIRCTVEGPIEIKSFSDTLDVKIADKVRVEVDQAYASPGTSSGNPVYIRTAD